MLRRRVVFVLSCLVLSAALAVVACRPAVAPPPTTVVDKEPDYPAVFEDITATSGIAWTNRNGEDTAPHMSILESLGGGIGLIDFDGDGMHDVFVPGCGVFSGPEKKDIVGHPSKFYRNLGGGTFKDVTAEAGLDTLAGGAPWFYTHGAGVADFDRDGRPDLLVSGWGRIALFKNVAVDEKDPTKGRKFVDVSKEMGIDKGVTWATSVAWADFDGDGYPDLYVTQYVDWSWKNNPPCSYDNKTPDVCPPKSFKGLQHLVFRNDAGKRLVDVTKTSGLKDPTQPPPGQKADNDTGKDTSKGLGCIAVDVNGDGKPDVYVANDTVDNFLYVNKSKPGLIVFEEVGLGSGCARDERANPNGSMGVDAGDYDGRGKPAIWVTNYENELHALYANQCDGSTYSFLHQTAAAKIAAIGQTHVGWGTAFIDVDLDGWEDLFVSNGHAIRTPTSKGVTRRQRPVLLRNTGGKFERYSTAVGTYRDEPHLGRGVGFGDLDNDGRTDMVISHTNEPVSVLRGIGGKDNHWLGVTLKGRGHADYVGAKATLRVGGRTLTRFAKGGGSYASSNDKRLIFGLGKESNPGTLTVTWPDGTTTKVEAPKADGYVVVEQR